MSLPPASRQCRMVSARAPLFPVAWRRYRVVYTPRRRRALLLDASLRCRAVFTTVGVRMCTFYGMSRSRLARYDHVL